MHKSKIPVYIYCQSIDAKVDIFIQYIYRNPQVTSYCIIILIGKIYNNIATCNNF